MKDMNAFNNKLDAAGKGYRGVLVRQRLKKICENRESSEMLERTSIHTRYNGKTNWVKNNELYDTNKCRKMKQMISSLSSRFCIQPMHWKKATTTWTSFWDISYLSATHELKFLKEQVDTVWNQYVLEAQLICGHEPATGQTVIYYCCCRFRCAFLRWKPSFWWTKSRAIRVLDGPTRRPITYPGAVFFRFLFLRVDKSGRPVKFSKKKKRGARLASKRSWRVPYTYAKDRAEKEKKSQHQNQGKKQEKTSHLAEVVVDAMINLS